MSESEFYPKWLYHATEAAVIVASRSEHKALGAGWYESPADVPAAKPAKAAKPGKAEGAEPGETAAE